MSISEMIWSKGGNQYTAVVVGSYRAIHCSSCDQWCRTSRQDAVVGILAKSMKETWYMAIYNYLDGIGSLLEMKMTQYEYDSMKAII